MQPEPQADISSQIQEPIQQLPDVEIDLGIATDDIQVSPVDDLDSDLEDGSYLSDDERPETISLESLGDAAADMLGGVSAYYESKLDSWAAWLLNKIGWDDDIDQQQIGEYTELEQLLSRWLEQKASEADQQEVQRVRQLQGICQQIIALCKKGYYSNQKQIEELEREIENIGVPSGQVMNELRQKSQEQSETMLRIAASPASPSEQAAASYFAAENVEPVESSSSSCVIM